MDAPESNRGDDINIAIFLDYRVPAGGMEVSFPVVSRECELPTP